MNLQASLDRFHGKLYNGVLGVHNAPFSSPLPTHLLSSFFLSVSLSSHLSFVPFFLHSDHNGIWQDFVTSSNLPFREQEQKTWSKETEREGRRRGRENWHTHTQSTQTSSSEHLFLFHLIFFIVSVLFSPDWLVVKLMLEYRTGKGLKADTSFMACTCQYQEHTDVNFKAFFSPFIFMTRFNVWETKTDTCSVHYDRSTNARKWGNICPLWIRNKRCFSQGMPN